MVALDGVTAAIWATLDDNGNGIDAGAAYVYRFDGESYHDYTAGFGAGSAYVYVHSEAWGVDPEAERFADMPVDLDTCGNGVGLDGDTLAISCARIPSR